MEIYNNNLSFNFLSLSRIEILIKEKIEYLKEYDQYKLEEYFSFLNKEEDKIWLKNSIKIIDLMLYNDGSMTNFLKILIEKNKKSLKLNLIQSEKFDKNETKDKIFENNFLFGILQEKYNLEIKSNKIIKRVIEFFTENNEKENEKNVLMFGISFWNEEKYNSLYSSENEKKIPLGVILREKKIEFYKETKNECIEINSENKEEKDLLILRLSKYYKENELYFFLIETFQVKKLIQILKE